MKEEFGGEGGSMQIRMEQGGLSRVQITIGLKKQQQ